MSTRTQTERREHTRRRLLDTTIACIAQHGYRATTTRRVAQAAGVSLGALAHHFPSRQELITAALADVVTRARLELESDASDPARRTEALLDRLWEYFHGELFTVWIKVWLAAAEDDALYAELAPIETRLNEAIARSVGSYRPSELAAAAWRARITVALHAIRGLVLTLSLEPREHVPARDPWPPVRAELAALLNR